VIPVDSTPEPGQVRDINTYTLSAFCRQSGTDPHQHGLCKDNFSNLREMVTWALNLPTPCGCQVEARRDKDLTVQVLESFDDAEVLVHGISISPGNRQ